ncbi:DUF421 domain-containing protein [Novipirellula sp. SH528]|uniref:DUF421 domain-containing protein n=1 Tax=Novipirellula sp. SH528 TaxID=3454466 RepID=UPI003FA10374
MNDIGFKMIFDGWAPVVRTLVLGTLSYLALVFLLRLSGKRTLSKMNAFDLVVTVAFGSTLASILTSRQVSLTQGVLALGLLVLLQLVNTFLAVRYSGYQTLIKAQPTLIFFQGQFLTDAMRKQRVSQEEVLAAMRQHGVAEPNEVDAVVIETEGSLSVLAKNASSLDALDRVGVSTSGSLGNRKDAAKSSSH